jgi:hypothetical protein
MAKSKGKFEGTGPGIPALKAKADRMRDNAIADLTSVHEGKMAAARKTPRDDSDSVPDTR